MNFEAIEKVNESLPTIQSWAGIVVKNEEQYRDATIKVASARDIIDKINDYWKPQIDAAYRTHKELCKRRDEMRKPVEAVINKISEAINKYTATRKTIESQAVTEEIKTVIVTKTIVEVKSIKELAKAVAEGTLPEAILEANTKELQKLAEVATSIPGCEIKKVNETQVRRTK